MNQLDMEDADVSNRKVKETVRLNQAFGDSNQREQAQLYSLQSIALELNLLRRLMEELILTVRNQR